MNPSCSSAAVRRSCGWRRLKRWTDRPADYPTTDMTFHRHYERKIIVVKQNFPLSPINALCTSAVQVGRELCIWETWLPLMDKAAMFSPLLYKLEHCTISAQTLTGGVNPARWCQWKGEVKILLIGGIRNQSEVCPSVQWQAFKRKYCVDSVSGASLTYLTVCVF